jgi:dihydropteroate synthase
MEALIGGRRFSWGARAYVMGIINVTPDSFSGDGVAGRPDAAISQGLRMLDEGADLLDVGGESTRPGYIPVSEADELARVLGVVSGLVATGRAPVSVDTTKPAVAAACLKAGAAIVNDIWGLSRAPELATLAARSGAAVVVMHNQVGTEYGRDLMAEISASLRESVAIAVRAGVPPERVIVDPGIGFGKTAEQNVEVLRRLGELRDLGQPILVGTSRKSFLEKIFGLALGDRLFGTAASVAAAVLKGADIVRVHDVAEMSKLVRVAQALR